jgi:redox-sensitive bicupin YhaK (pirin superfamily)
MIDGHMRHEDHLGNVGELRSGGVQWMTAGRGVIHSEMPQQESGRMRGFQLWLNLPAAEKMKPASYRDIPAADLPSAELPGGGRVTLIAGRLSSATADLVGPINGQRGEMRTDPLFLDLTLPPGGTVEVPIPTGHNAFTYVYEGSLDVGGTVVAQHQAGLLDDGDRVTLQAGADGVRAVLIAGRPLGEPVVQYGPFVMNTRQEIEQALADFRDGRLTG